MGKSGNLKDLQNKILELVEYFDVFCKKHDIVYFLMGGTALGAVRHSGFIPWDDDFDVFMDHKNYQKFCHIVKYDLDKDKYFFQEENSEELPLYFSKLRINNTTLIEEDIKERKMHQGIFIDIMCLYNTPNNLLLRYIQYFSARVLSTRALADKGYLTNSFIKHLSISLSRVIVVGGVKSQLLKFIRRFNFKERKLIGHFFGRTSFKRASFRKEILGTQRFVKFEHLQLPVPEYVEEYLEITFGEDFMELPSQKERAKHPSHAYIFDVNKSFEVYMNGVQKWRKYNGAIIPSLAPDIVVSDSQQEIKSYLISNNAWFARWTSDFDSNIKSEFWHIIQDKALELEDYNSKTRNKIRKGLKNCTVKLVNREEVIHAGYPSYYNAFLGYNTYELPLAKDQFVSALNLLEGKREYWGIYNNDGLMIGYAQNHIIGDYCDYSSIKLHPDYLKLRPGETLIFTMNNYYLNEKKFRFVNNGTRSISHHTNIQSFLMEKFKFRKAYCKLHIIYTSKMKFMVTILFPFRKMIKYIPGSIAQKTYNILIQEKIARSFK